MSLQDVAYKHHTRILREFQNLKKQPRRLPYSSVPRRAQSRPRARTRQNRRADLSLLLFAEPAPTCMATQAWPIDHHPVNMLSTMHITYTPRLLANPSHA
jgi:hypothetical protein